MQDVGDEASVPDTVSAALALDLGGAEPAERTLRRRGKDICTKRGIS
jgi:hypothetical protein